MKEHITTLEVAKKYKDYTLTFNFYFKYTFIYVYEDERIRIVASFGGISDDVYGYSLNEKEKLDSLLRKDNLSIDITDKVDNKEWECYNA